MYVIFEPSRVFVHSDVCLVSLDVVYEMCGYVAVVLARRCGMWNLCVIMRSNWHVLEVAIACSLDAMCDDALMR